MVLISGLMMRPRRLPQKPWRMPLMQQPELLTQPGSPLPKVAPVVPVPLGTPALPRRLHQRRKVAEEARTRHLVFAAHGAKQAPAKQAWTGPVSISGPLFGPSVCPLRPGPAVCFVSSIFVGGMPLRTR